MQELFSNNEIISVNLLDFRRLSDFPDFWIGKNIPFFIESALG